MDKRFIMILVLFLLVGSIMVMADERTPFTTEWFGIRANSENIKGDGVPGALDSTEGKYYVIGSNLYFVASDKESSFDKADPSGTGGILVQAADFLRTKVGLAPSPPAAAAPSPNPNQARIDAIQGEIRVSSDRYSTATNFEVLGSDASEWEISPGNYVFDDNDHITGPGNTKFYRESDGTWKQDVTGIDPSVDTGAKLLFERNRGIRESENNFIAEKRAELVRLGVPAAPFSPTGAAAEPSPYTPDAVQRDLAKGVITHFEASERLDVLAAQAAPAGSTVLIGGKLFTKQKEGTWTPKEGGAISNNDLQKIDRTGKDVSSLSLPQKIPSPTAEQIGSASDGSTVVVNGGTLTRRSGVWKNDGDVTVYITDNDFKKGKVKNFESKEAKDAEEARKIQEAAQIAFYQSTWFESLHQRTAEGPANVYGQLQQYTELGGAFFQGLARLGSYRAFSHAYFPDLTQSWINAADNEFLNTWADVPGRITVEACGIDDFKQSERAGQNAVFIRTATGIDQPAGSIFAEISPSTSPILCERNPDEDAEEQFLCNDGMVCKENTFCYEQETNELPAEGYFYKITWGVSAPADAKFTPYVDEDGKAVKLNVALFRDGAAPVWLYESDLGWGDAVIELANGDTYTETITRYAPKDLHFSKACIVFNSNYRIRDFEGDEIPQICATFETSEAGKIEFAKSDRSASSITPATGQIRRNRNWR